MQKVFTKNRIVGILMVLLAIVVFVASSTYPEPTITGDIGSKAFPMIASGACAVCGILLMLPVNQKDNKKGSLNKEQWIKALTLFGLYVVYYLLLYLFGYFVGTFVSMFLMFFVISREKKIPIWRGILFAAIVTVAVYALFHLIFSIRMPKGILF